MFLECQEPLGYPKPGRPHYQASIEGGRNVRLKRKHIPIYLLAHHPRVVRPSCEPLADPIPVTPSLIIVFKGPLIDALQLIQVVENQAARGPWVAQTVARDVYVSLAAIIPAVRMF